MTLWGHAVSKLRWTLLILGGGFILALGLWERWRPRHARGPGAKERGSARHVLAGEDLATRPGTDLSDTVLADPDEPWIGEPGLADALLSPKGEPGQSGPERSWMARGTGSGQAHPGIGRVTGEWPAMLESHREERGSGGAGAAQREGWLSEIRSHEAASEGQPDAREEPLAAPAALAADDVHSSAEKPLRVVLAEDLHESPTAELPVLAEAAVDVPASQALDETAALEGPRPVAPVVRWPPEASRQIVALRLVAPPERFPGRAVRLALAAEGFLLGEFDIFHKPDETHRAIVSVASLTRPGTFDLDTMDSQRYAGLSLFVVLPGPSPEHQAFDEPVAVALNLCERLQGELQDAQGGALTGESIGLLRESLFAGTGGEAAS